MAAPLRSPTDRRPAPRPAPRSSVPAVAERPARSLSSRAEQLWGALDRDEPRPAPAGAGGPSAAADEASTPPVSRPTVADGPHRQLELTLTDLAEVLAVYPHRGSMPVCTHCVSDDEARMLGRPPGRITNSVLDRYVAKSMITWGDTVDFKRLLPEVLTRLCDGRLGPPDALVGARLRRAGWLTWPAAEAPAVRRTLQAIWLTTLASAPGPGRAPATQRLGLIASAEDDIEGYLDLWEDRLDTPGNPNARLVAVLHLADLLAPLAEGGRRRLTRGFPLARRSVVAQLDHWLRQPVVIQRLTRAADALDHTEHGPLVARARQGLARLRTDG